MFIEVRPKIIGILATVEKNASKINSDYIWSASTNTTSTSLCFQMIMHAKESGNINKGIPER